MTPLSLVHPDPAEPVRVDVDGDGQPDLVTPAAEVATPSTDLVVLVEDEAALVPVDPPVERPDVYVKILARMDADRRPVIPFWMQSRADFAYVVGWVGGYTAHVSAFHAVRAPYYTGRVAWFAPQGLARVIYRVGIWANDSEVAPLLQSAASRDKAEEYEKLSRVRDRHRRGRWTITALGSGLVSAAGAGLVMAPSGLLQVSAAAGAALVSAWYGTPRDKNLISRSTSAIQAPLRLNPGMVEAALGSLGISKIDQALKGSQGIAFPEPIVRDGPGWRAVIDLPLGVTALDIQARKAALASGLRKPAGAVWPEGDADVHEGRLVLWVGDKAMSKTRQPAWPLAKTGRADIFGDLPFGFDQRLRSVGICLMYNNMLIGAIPRQGKTVALRDLVLGASLDPTVEVHANELKGTADLKCVERLSHRYASGPADPQTLDEVMVSLREVHGYLTTRANTIAGLPVSICKDRKVTRVLADRRELGLHPVLLVIDEVQELFESDHRAEAVLLLKAIIKRGPALGIMLILSTQKPDKDALPTIIASNMGIRYCLRVMDQIANDMVLGTSAYKVGMNATLFTDSDKGVGLLRDGGSAQVVRTANIDSELAEKIGYRAYEVRAAMDLLSGQAVGQDAVITNRYQVLLDLDRVWPVSEDRMWSKELVELLAQMDDGAYGGWDQTDLAVALGRLGVKTRQMQKTVNQKPVNNRGLDRSVLDRALAQTGSDSEDDEEE
jgi:S-DNA-T family DNA segregation ATPase FtsK/SpoIIIE